MDVVVTIAKGIWLGWLAEGDLPGEETTGEWGLYYGQPGSPRPATAPKHARPGDRVYVAAHGFLRGWAPLIRVEPSAHGFALIRGGGAVACTICQGPEDGAGSPVAVKGFQGVRYRWWDRAVEGPFANWMEHGLPPRDVALVARLRRLRADPARRHELQARALEGATVAALFAGMP